MRAHSSFCSDESLAHASAASLIRPPLQSQTRGNRVGPGRASQGAGTGTGAARTHRMCASCDLRSADMFLVCSDTKKLYGRTFFLDPDADCEK